MKKLLSISLKIVLLFVFTTATYFSAWACDKSKAKKEVQHTVSKCQKACCKKEQSSSKSNCQTACCQKQSSDTQKQKKGCCGDGDCNCNCSISTTVLADLPKLLILDFSSPTPVFIFKNDFFYKQVFSTSSVNDIWQPPISVLSI